MWKQIRDTNYEASEEGEIRNKETLCVLIPFLKPKGYLCIGLSENNKRKTHLVHRLIAEAFLENYSKNIEVHHINAIRHDNRLVNLKCVSRYENLLYRINSLYSIQDIERIIFLHETQLTPEQIYSTLRAEAIINKNKVDLFSNNK